MKGNGRQTFNFASLSVFRAFKECLTMAPYNPYLAITDPSPQVFSVRLHFALRF